MLRTHSYKKLNFQTYKSYSYRKISTRSVIGSQTTGATTDPYFNYVSLLLHGDGANAATNNTFIDSSTNAFSITRTGTATQGTFTPFTGTAYSAATIGGSMYFNGSTDYLTITGNTSISAVGAGDFTIECWVNLSSALASGTTYGSQVAGPANGFNNGWAIIVNRANNGAGVNFAIGNALVLTVSGMLTTGVWHHIAVVRSGLSTNNLKLYVNGVNAATTTYTTNDTFSGATYIGSQAGGTLFDGYISNLRMVKGTAVYTGNFTPSTVPLTAITNTTLLLSGTNAGIIDNAKKNNLISSGSAQISTAQKKFGSGSIYIPTNTTYVSAPSSAEFALGTGDFTFESWVYLTNNGVNLQTIFTIGTYLNGLLFRLYDFTNGIIDVYCNGSNYTFSTPLSYMTANTWHHYALVRSSGNIKVFADGVQVGSTTAMSQSIAQAGLIVGMSQHNGTEYIHGYIDDFRFTKGIARYTENFTLPTTAFSDN